MSRLSRRRTLAATATVLVLAAGCGQGDGSRASVAPAASATQPAPTAGDGAGAVPATGPGCPPATGGALPADAVPPAAYSCTLASRHVAGDGEWLFRVRRRATNVDRLVDALRLPSQPSPADAACTWELRQPAVVLLEVDGRLVPVESPRDSCRKPRREVSAAYDALSWTEVGRTPVRRLRSEAAYASGCDTWEDALATDAGTIARPGGPGDLPTVGRLRVCRYRSLYPDGRTPASSVVVAGDPTGGFVPTGDVGDRIVRALAAAGPAAACGNPRHARFAIVFLGTGQAYVELDGCHRILAPDSSLRQATPELVTLLTTG